MYILRYWINGAIVLFVIGTIVYLIISTFLKARNLQKNEDHDDIEKRAKIIEEEKYLKQLEGEVLLGVDPEFTKKKGKKKRNMTPKTPHPFD